MQEERLRILSMVEEGQISAGEAATLLAALAAPVEAEGPPPVTVNEPDAESHWRRFWIYPFLAGGGLLIAGVFFLSLLAAVGAAPGWLLCGWTPLILGLLLAILAWWSRSATWLHLRIREESRLKMAFSFPLPLTLAAWALRVAEPFVPQLRDTGVDDLIIALRHSSAEGQPLVVDVEDDESGEHVQIYIG